MRLKENRFTVKIPVYDSDIHVIVTTDIQKSYIKLCKKLNWLNLLEDDQDSSQDSACFVYGDDEVGDYYMIFPYQADIFVVSHEVLHATFIILEDHNVIFDRNNHEAFTYLHGHLMEIMYNKLKALK